MIPANELRIGNWVQPIVGAAFQVDYIKPIKALDGYGVLIGNNEQKNGFENSFLPEHLMPIELTPEILEKCGFEPTGEFGGNPYCNQYIKNHIEIFYDERTMLTYFGYFNGNKERKTVVRVPYLHQLQNLYYVLVGQELSITGIP